MRLKIQKLDPDAVIPIYATEGSSGFDICLLNDLTIKPGETVLAPTGLAIELHGGYEIQIRPRSGITLNTPFRVHFGTIDSDFVGEIQVIITNTSTTSQTINKHTKIAQGVIQMYYQADFLEVDKIKTTKRGSGGFGSTDV